MLASLQSSLAVDGQALNNDRGAIQAAANTRITTGAASNRAGLVSAHDVTLQTDAFSNEAGRVIAAGALSARTDDLNNTGGLLQSIGALSINTQGHALLNNDSGSNGGIVAGSTLAVHTGSLDNRTGAILSAGDQSLTSTAGLDNRDGRLASNARLTASAANLQNTGGSVQALGDLQISASGTLDNRGGAFVTAADARFNVGSLNNSSAGSIDARDITVAATSVNNQTGAIRSAGDATLSATSLDNRNGSLTAQGQLGVNATQLQNAGGRIVGDRSVNLATASTAPGGTVASANDVSLSVAGDWQNTGLLSANRNLSISADHIGNTGTLTAGSVFTANADSLANSGEISAAVTRISVDGTLTNSGLIDGIDTRVQADTLNNTGRIYGDQLVVTGDSVSNSDTGVIAARDLLLIGARTLQNSDQAIVYSAGNMAMGAGLTSQGVLQGSMQTLRNVGATIESAGDMQLAVADLQNLNADLRLGSQTTTRTPNQRLIQEESTGRKYDPATLGWDAGWHDHGRYVLESTTYPLATFGAVKISPAALQVPVTSGLENEPGEYRTEYVYGRTHPVWARFGAAAPNFSDLTNPSVPAGYWSCQDVDGARISSGPCATYWTDKDAYDAEVERRNAAAAAELDVHIAAFNADVTSRSFEGWYEHIVTEREQIQTVVLSSQPGRISAGGDLTVLGGGRSQDSIISAGGTLRLPFAAQSTQGTRTVTESGQVRHRRIEHHGGFQDDYDEELTPWTPYTDAPEVTTIDLATTTSPAAAPTLARSNAEIDASRAAGVRNSTSARIDNTAATISARTDAPRSVQQDGEHAQGRATTTPQNQTLQQDADIDAAQAATVQAAQAIAPASADAVARTRSTDVRLQPVLATDSAIPTPATVKTSAPRGSSTALPSVQKVRLKGTAASILTTTPNLQAPSSQLFTLHPAPGANHLVETDPRFTNHRNYLSSDYFLNQLKLDPERQMKRYGDGFAEQQLINEQVLALTQRRTLDGYATGQDQYRALMDAGVAFAQAYQLTPGVALSAEQMALLTTDIVWLVAQDVSLPDGSTQQVLVPQVYLRRAQEGDLQANGSLIAADRVILTSPQALSNSGTVSGNQVFIDAGSDFTNTGRIQGQTVVAQAQRDLQLIGGRIQGQGADSTVVLNAGRDLQLQTTTLITNAGTAHSHSTRTGIDRIATVQGGNISLQAGRDLLAQGSQVTAAADLVAQADGRIVLASVQTNFSRDISSSTDATGQRSRLHESSTGHQATNFTAGADLAVIAASDLRIQGANLQAGNDALLSAAQIDIRADVNTAVTDNRHQHTGGSVHASQSTQTLSGAQIQAGQHLTVQTTQGDLTARAAQFTAQSGQVSLIAHDNLTLGALSTQHQSLLHVQDQDSSALGSRASRSIDKAQGSQLTGSTVSGHSVLMQSQTGDIRIQASTVVADQALQIQAAKDVTLTSQTQTSRSTSRHDEHQNGLFASGASITIGSQSVAQQNQQTITQQVGSQIGSLSGDVSIRAGGHYQQTASSVAALAGDIGIVAQSVDITYAEQSANTNSAQQMRQGGLSIGISSSLIQAVQSAQQMSEAAGQTQDSRIQALAAASAAMSVVDAVNATNRVCPGIPSSGWRGFGDAERHGA